MAKYKLNESGSKSVGCDILGENLNNYVVRFSNGLIQEVVKDKVCDFNEVDEGVLDLVKNAAGKVRDFGGRVGSGIKTAVEKIRNFFANAFKVSGFVFFESEDGEILSAVHPINTMIGAQESDCTNFIPSDSLVQYSEEVGVVPRIIDNFELGGKYEGAIQGYEGVSESVKESVKPNSVIGAFLNEDESKDLISLSYNKDPNQSGEFVIEDWNTEAVVAYLLREYRARWIGKKAGLPLFLWGAPGIGKTAIITSIREKIKEMIGEKPSVIVVAAPSVNEDSFSFPASVEKAFKDGVTGAIGNKTVVTDLPKDWLPVYNPDSSTLEAEKCTANGGHFDKEKRAWIDGPGGIIFIDEFARMSPGSKSALYTLPNDRYFGTRSMTIGDKWIIVAAANRKEDLGAASKGNFIARDAAAESRFKPVNYVPKFEEWKAWAVQKTNGVQNVLDEIIRYVEFSLSDQGNPDKNPTGDYYRMDRFGQSGNATSEQDKACPRTWEAYSNDIRLCLDEVSAGMSPEDVELNKKFGLGGYSSVVEMANDVEGGGLRQLKQLGYATVGKYPTDRFIGWLGQITFTQGDAKNVWEKGANASYSFASGLNTDNCRNFFNTVIIPLLKANVPGGKIAQTGLSPELVENFVDFLISVMPKNSGGKTSPVSAFSAIVDEFKRQFKVDLHDHDKQSIYADSINKVADFEFQNNSAAVQP